MKLIERTFQLHNLLKQFVAVQRGLWSSSFIVVRWNFKQIICISEHLVLTLVDFSLRFTEIVMDACVRVWSD